MKGKLMKTNWVAVFLMCNAAAQGVPVTFQVDMTGAAGFSPFSDVVDVRGSFNNWSGGARLFPGANPKILTNTFEVADAPGTVEAFKFTRNAVFELIGVGNRSFTLQGTAQTLPLVYFDNRPPTVSATTNAITFQVNMSAFAALGAFDPINDTVSVAGTFQSPNQWASQVCQLTAAGNNVFTGTFNDGNYEGTYEEFKFIITRYGLDTWESINNRSFFVTNHEVLPIVYFGGAGTTVPVTFQVDMSGVAGFNPSDLVDVRGTFNAWNGGANLVPSENPYILTNTFQIADPPGTAEAYKFTWNWSYELQGLGNRPFTMPASAQALPLVYFGDLVPPVSATTNSVTFRVSLATQVAIGNFDPVQDIVSVAGLFQSPNQWVPQLCLLTNTGANNLYMGTVTKDGNYPGSYEEYKFVITRGGNDIWESINNRWFLLINHGVLPVVFFNNQGTAVPVTFQVDLSVQAATNRLNPGDIVECKGSFNGWAGGFQLTNDPAASNPYLFTGTTYLFDGPGAAESYRFTVNGGYSGLGWESPQSLEGNNRSFTLGSAPLVLPPVLWADQTASDLLAEQTLVTFTVNMTNAVGTDGHAFDPMVDNVYLNGDWMPWWSWGSPPPELVLTNDPPGGLYSLTMAFPQGYAVPLNYKYSINGADNEATFGTNHLRYIRATGSYYLPMDTFGNQSHELSFGNLRIQPASTGRAWVTWLGRPGVHLQTATNLTTATVWQDRLETDGQSATNYPVSGQRAFFRLVKP